MDHLRGCCAASEHRHSGKEDYWSAKFDVTERVKKTFDEAGIVIPFLQRSVHVVAASKV